MSFYWITEQRRRELEQEREAADRMIAQAMPKIIKAIQLKGKKP